MTKPPEPSRIRLAVAADVAHLAALWHAGWHDAHAAIVPAGLTRARSLASMEARLRTHLGVTRTAGPVGHPLGFTMVRGPELYQVYVAAQARGTGLAQALTADALAQVFAAGPGPAWLDCAEGNTRAARFNAKTGWLNRGLRRLELPTQDGAFEIMAWRFEHPGPA